MFAPSLFRATVHIRWSAAQARVLFIEGASASCGYVKVRGVAYHGPMPGLGRVLGGHMKFLGMGVPELLIILVVILLIFGPKNLPKLGSALGKTVKNLREGMGDSKKAEEEADEVETEEDDEDAAKKKTTAARKKSE